MTLPQKLYNYLTDGHRQPGELITPDMASFFDENTGYCLWHMTEDDFLHFLKVNKIKKNDTTTI